MSKSSTSAQGPQAQGKTKRNTKLQQTVSRLQSVQAGTNLASPDAATAKIKMSQINNTRKTKQRGRFSDQALSFLTCALDPMHDTAVEPTGWPDRNVELSVVRKIPQSLSISAPSGNPHIPAGSSWDLHVHLNPWFQQLPFHLRTRVNSVFYGPTESPTYIGGVQAYAVPAGANFGYTDNGSTGLAPLLGSLCLDPSYTVGVGRVIGCGLEIVNTTAEIYRSGMIYAWRAPEPNSEPALWYQQEPAPGTPSLNADVPFVGQPFRHPPKNAAECQLYVGTTAWAAKEGAYSVSTFHDFENPATSVQYTQPIMPQDANVEDREYSIDTPTDYNTSSVYITTPFQTGGDLTGRLAIKILPINQNGFILTGLTSQSTFTLRWNVFYESFPSIAQANILTLAKPSTRYDPKVLQLLAMISRSLPVAVYSRDNAEGDWWDRVLQAIQVLAPAVLSVTGFGSLTPAVEGLLEGVRMSRNNNG